MGKRTRNKQDEPELEADDTAEEPEPKPDPVRKDKEPTGEFPDPTGEIPRPEGEGAEGDEGRRSRVMRFAKRLMDRRELTTDTREILGTVLATSDKAKTEAVRMVAREVRSYLDALELKEDFKQLITSYSLEISLSLKPLEHAMAEAPAPAPADPPKAQEEDEED